jgi:16S rRNA (uracil1498-N3)-methyltransferase
MRIPRIYQPADIDIGTVIELEAAAAHHLCRVLRLKHQDQIILFNGQGGEYLSSMQLQGKKVFAVAEEYFERNVESKLDIGLWQGISRGDRMDISIQKAVELGVRRIVPVICQRTVVNLKHERMEKKLQHWQGVIISACEQSGRTVIPQLEPPIKLHERLAADTAGMKLTMNPEAGVHLGELSPAGDSITLLIGPEGGLTEAEISQAAAGGFQGIKLGPRVLRTETAALAAIAAIQTRWGDF